MLFENIPFHHEDCPAFRQEKFDEYFPKVAQIYCQGLLGLIEFIKSTQRHLVTQGRSAAHMWKDLEDCARLTGDMLPACTHILPPTSYQLYSSSDKDYVIAHQSPEAWSLDGKNILIVDEYIDTERKHDANMLWFNRAGIRGQYALLFVTPQGRSVRNSFYSPFIALKDDDYSEDLLKLVKLRMSPNSIIY